MAICVELRINLEWADKQNPYVLLDIIKHINKMRNPDGNKKKEKLSARNLKQFVKEGE